MAKMETVKMDLKLGPEEKRILKNLTRSLDSLARAMQVNNPQKPKNDTIRIDGQTIRFTEPANLDEGMYVAGKITPEQVDELKSRYPEMYDSMKESGMLY